jgi:TPR repeat
MIRFAFERDIDAALASDRFHNSQRKVEAFEDRTLLDVEFQITECTVLDSRVENSRRIESKRADRVKHPSTIAIFGIQQLIVGGAHQRAASKERHAKAHALFLRKAHHFDPELEPPPRNQFHERDREHHSQDTIESPSPGNRIKMRPDKKGRHVTLRSIVAPPHIAGCVHMNAHTGILHPRAESRMNFMHRGREKPASCKTGFFCKFRKLTTSPDDVVRKRERRMHQVPTSVPIDDTPQLTVGRTPPSARDPWSHFILKIVNRISLLAALLAAALCAQQEKNKPPPKPSDEQKKAQQQQKEEEPPEEDESIKPKEYSFNPLEAERDLKIGNYYFKKGNYKAALNRFREASRWNPAYAEAFLRMGESEEKLKDKAAAAEAYAKFLDLAPDAKEAESIKKKLAGRR